MEISAEEIVVLLQTFESSTVLNCSSDIWVNFALILHEYRSTGY